MIPKKEISQIKKEMQLFDDEREKLIRESRDILKLSKQAIYSVHRGELKIAESLLSQAKEKIGRMSLNLKKNPKLLTTGNYNAALEEYVEAACYLSYVRTGRIPSKTDLKVDAETYLLGLCDLTGELGRRAVLEAIKKDVKEVVRIKDAVEDIFGLMVQLNLRNSELRKKSDSIKWNLKKIEEIIYDLKRK